MKKLLPLFAFLFLCHSIQAKDHKITLWLCNSVEGGLFQIGTWQAPAFKNSAGNTINVKSIPRFSYFCNTGADANYQVVKGFSIFTGLNLKNIGMIMKLDTVKYKHCVYTLGLPLGFRIHKANHKTWVKAGIDFSWALHYKLKTFEEGREKIKYNAWFSSRVASFYPSVFVGVNVSGISFGSNVYLQNFFNDKNTANLGYKANLITLGLGINVNKENSLRKKNKKKEESTDAVM